MKDQRLPQRPYWEWARDPFLFLTLAIASAATMVAVRPIWLLFGAACGFYLFFVAVSLRRPLILVTVFLVFLIAFPPLYFSSLGDTPIYLSSLLVPIGLAVLVARLPDFDLPLDEVAVGLVLFLVGTGLSLPFGWWLSGQAIGNQSLLRWLLLAQTALIFALVRGAARWGGDRVERGIMAVLLVAAVASAGYGVVDFFWPIPLPHPAADQFIWLETAMVRRAQGVFYEASSFGNLCGLFLVIASAAFLAGQERAVRIARPWLLLCITILSFAVFVCFSRSTWGNVIVSLAVFVARSGMVKRRRAWGFFVAFLTPMVLLWFYFPELWNYFTGNRIGYFGQILGDPNLVTSGRLETWATVFSILRDHPKYLLFGIGYKTLPFTRLFHQEIITDNGFLNLLLETGILGLGSFLAFSATVFKSFWRLSRKSVGTELFWSAVLFSLWCGEWVQMMATDAYTYWRSMVVLIALMAFVLNGADRTCAPEFRSEMGEQPSLRRRPKFLGRANL
jgi:O-antigen ligase